MESQLQNQNQSNHTSETGDDENFQYSKYKLRNKNHLKTESTDKRKIDKIKVKERHTRQ